MINYIRDFRAYMTTGGGAASHELAPGLARAGDDAVVDQGEELSPWEPMAGMSRFTAVSGGWTTWQ